MAVSKVETGSGFLFNLRCQLRVIAALILREARVKHGRSRLGYTWAIIDPVFLIIILSYLFNSFRSAPPHGEYFSIFFATGVLSYQFYRNSSMFISMSFRANQALFSYPLVKQIDAAVARLILEFSTTAIVMTLVIGAQIFFFDLHWPADFTYMLMVMALIAQFGFGTGLTNAVIQRFFPSWQNIFQIIMGPTFFVSGIFYTMSSIPTYYREILAWNPIIHCVEGFRNGYYPDYPANDLDLVYLFWWGFSLTFIGLVAERIVKRESK